MSSSFMWMVIGPLARGAAISNAERYCDEIRPEISVRPPVKPLACTTTGGHPVSLQLMSTPNYIQNCCANLNIRVRKYNSAMNAKSFTKKLTCNNPSTRSLMGRSLIRGVPSSTKLPCPAQTTAASGRIAVPALPRKITSSRSTWKGPPLP